MYLVTIWTKTVTKTMIVASGIFTMINVLVWYYVLQRIVNDINNFWLIAAYAVGCALGTIVALIHYNAYFQKRVNP